MCTFVQTSCLICLRFSLRDRNKCVNTNFIMYFCFVFLNLQMSTKVSKKSFTSMADYLLWCATLWVWTEPELLIINADISSICNEISVLYPLHVLSFMLLALRHPVYTDRKVLVAMFCFFPLCLLDFSSKQCWHLCYTRTRKYSHMFTSGLIIMATSTFLVFTCFHSDDVPGSSALI